MEIELTVRPTIADSFISEIPILSKDNKYVIDPTFHVLILVLSMQIRSKVHTLTVTLQYKTTKKNIKTFKFLTSKVKQTTFFIVTQIMY